MPLGVSIGGWIGSLKDTNSNNNDKQDKTILPMVLCRS
jgi:hypothetical protein